MAYPDIYDVTYSYTGFQEAQGDNSFPGTQIDADLAGLNASVSSLALFVQGVMRSDGALNNAIVTYDSLAPSLQTAGLTPADAWATATAYLLNKNVIINSTLYRCLIPHTSGVFATDLAAGKWVFVAALQAGTNGTNGANGSNGSNGAGYGGTSVTSLVIGTGTKVFATQAGLAYAVGSRARAASNANPLNFMEGVVTAYAAGSLTLSVTLVGGSGTLADWNFSVAGNPGAPGLSTATLVSPQGRLTLSSGNAVTVSDITGATTIYHTPSSGHLIPVNQGSGLTMVDAGAEVSLALDSTSAHTGYHQSGKCFDLFFAWVSGTLYFGSGPAWTDDADRSAVVTTNDGFVVNNATMLLRFGSASGNTVSVPAGQATIVGGFTATGDGTAEDSFVKRLLWNAYNQVPKFMKRFETTDSWTDTVQSWKQANSSTANQLEYFCGLLLAPVKAESNAIATTTSATNVFVQSGIGINSTTVNSADRSTMFPISSGADLIASPSGGYYGYPGLGHNKLVWLLWGNTGVTFSGDGGDTDNRIHAGITAEITC